MYCGLLLADFLDALVDVLVGDFRIVVRDLDVLIVLPARFRERLRIGLEAQRLAVVEMDVGDIGRADHVQVFGFDLLLQMLGNQVLQHLLPDIAGELLADQRSRRLAGTEAGEFGALLDVGDDAAVSLSTASTGMEISSECLQPSTKAKWIKPQERKWAKSHDTTGGPSGPGVAPRLYRAALPKECVQ